MPKVRKKDPPKPGWLVLDLDLFAKPMVLLDHDGARPVTEGGVLFLTAGDYQPTRFPTMQEAFAAIDRTMAWLQAQEHPGGRVTIQRYRVISTGSYEALQQDRGRRTERVRTATVQAKGEAPEEGAEGVPAGSPVPGGTT